MFDPAHTTLIITWSRVETYRAAFPAGVIADATGLSAEELLADPAMLFGVVNTATAATLEAGQTTRTRTGPTEIEIIDTPASNQPSLAELFDRARQLIQQEIDSGRPADHGLAALIAGLRREGLIN